LRNVAKIGVACLAVCMMFVGCDKGEGDLNENGSLGGNASKITATNVINGSYRISTVKVKFYWEKGDDWGSDVIVQAPYKDNGFTLALPATISDKYLYLLAKDAPSGITISDKTVKCVTDIDMEAFDKDDNNIGDFYLTDDDKSAYAMRFYVDKNVSVKGEYKEIDEVFNEEYIRKFDMDLKKGWNIVYAREAESHNNSTGRDVYTITITTQKPSGMNFSWYFEEYYVDYSVPLKSAIALSAKKSFFTKKEIRNN